MRAPTAIDHAKTPDLELAELAGLGDRDAFTALFDRHFPGLYDFAIRMVGDSGVAAEVVQDTFSRAWELIASGRRVPDLRAWLYAVARKGAVSRARTRGPARSHGSGVPAAEAALLDLHARRGLSAEELASALAAPPFTVRARLARARRHLGNGGDSLGPGPAIEAPPAVRESVRAHVGRTALTPGSWAGDPARASRASAWEGLAPLGAAALALVGRVHRARFPAKGIAERWGRLSSPKAIAVAVALAAAAAAVALGGGGGARPGPPARPGDVHSTSHRVGVASMQTVLAMAWRRPSGVTGYSIAFTRSAGTVPGRQVSLPASATAAHSGSLAPGRWWFHLRVRGRGGRWTGAIHSGPYVIVAPRAVPKPASSTATTPSTTAATPPPPPPRPAKRKPTRHAARPARPRAHHRPTARRRPAPPSVRRPPAAPTPRPTTSQPATTPPPTTTQPPPTGTQGGTPAAPG